MSFRRSSRPFVLSFLVLSLFPAPALLADPPDTPASWQFPDRSSSVTPEMLEFPALDLERIAIEDEFDQAMGKPPRFAVPRTISRSPVRDGSWVDLPNGRSIWRLQVEAADAVSLNFGFRDVYMPEDARLYIYSRDAGMARRYDRYEVLGPYGQEINEAHREFWSPILTASAAVIELDVPTLQRDRVSLELVQVGQGYRAFGAGQDRRVRRKGRRRRGTLGLLQHGRGLPCAGRSME